MALCPAPTYVIAENAGLEGSVVVNRIHELTDVNQGWDAEKDRWGDMFELGIVDPVKVSLRTSGLEVISPPISRELPVRMTGLPPLLYRNDGAWRFTAVTAAARRRPSSRLADPETWAHRA